MIKYGKIMVLALSIILMAVTTTSCKKNLSTQIVGKWVKIGEQCNKKGICKKKINSKSLLHFKKDGTFKAQYTSGVYVVKDKKIFITGNVLGMPFKVTTDIIYLKDDIMLGKTDGKIEKSKRVK